MLKEQLENVGFNIQDSVDPCLLTSNCVIIVIYVDDILFFSPKHEWIDEALNQLKLKEGTELEVKDELASFLGVSIERDPKN